MTGEMKVNPEKITITGAESKISQIKKAEAKINVDGLFKRYGSRGRTGAL